MSKLICAILVRNEISDLATTEIVVIQLLQRHNILTEILKSAFSHSHGIKQKHACGIRRLSDRTIDYRACSNWHAADTQTM